MKISLKKGRMMFVAILLALAMTITACGAQDGEKDTIIFADADWDSIRVHNQIAIKIAEHGYGYNTELMPGSETSSFQGIRSGDIDVYIEIWSGNIIDQYTAAVENGDIIELSLNYDDNMQGLYVPTYVIEGDPERGIEPVAPTLRTMEDLAKYWEVFEDPEDPNKGRIYGSIPGWFADEVLATQVEVFGLTEYFNYFQPGSDTALATSLVTAINNGEPWVGYYWEPTWISGQYDLTLLEVAEYSDELWADDFRCDFPSQRLPIAVQNQLPEQAPDLVEFLSNYETSSEITANALAYMQDNDATTEDTAIWFLNEYEDLWTSWVPADVADKVKEAIQ